MTFTHLEVHSHFTLLGATPSVPELVARARRDGLTHLALTDTDALYGAMAFARACREADIRPIVGMTITVAKPISPAAKAMDSPRNWGGGGGHDAGHLVLLAANPAGYRSLCRLSSLIQAGPKLDGVLPPELAQGLSWDDLAEHREGLLCLSGGRRGWIERYLRAGDYAAAQLYAGRLARIFEENAYLALELQEQEDAVVTAEVVALGQRLGLPAVAVQPVYCLAPEDAPRLRLLAAIRANTRLDVGASEESPLRWLSPAEVAARFARFPGAADMAGEIAARCGDCLPDGRPIWPALKLPANKTPDDNLAALAEVGLQAHYSPRSTHHAALPHVAERLQHELSVIAQHGYAPLFLVVADIVRFARDHEIPVSTRGSVANSLVAYCTGITTVDPIEHGLLFERFLNPARANPPDIDLDFCSRRRDEVLRYIRETYGPDRVALVGTVSTMQPQSAVRETGKAHGLPEAQIDRLAGLLPHRWHPDPRRRDKRTVDDVVATLDDPLEREILRTAYTLVGQPDHLSVHPGAVVITPGPLTDFVPVQWAPKGFLITQFEHGDVETLGLPKTDLLGIRALTVLADTAEQVRLDRDPAFHLADIPLDDALTSDMLERGETIGVFQCESDGAQRTLRKLRARTVADLAIANAFFKPGPAMGGMAQAFVRRYRGEEAVTYLHPALKPILGHTRGVLIFQEQILRVAREVAGLTWAQADQLRRGMSHFGAAEMEAIREQFVEGCRRPPPDGPGFSSSQAKTLWEQVIPFAGYGFNQGHATAYADVSFRSAYLKAHYPAQFLCARLADHGGFHHPVVYMAEAVRLGCDVRPPHVNFSGEAFVLVDNRSGGRRISEDEESRDWTNTRGTDAGSHASRITHHVLYMGLGAVRDLRQSAVAAIMRERGHGSFTGLHDLLRRVDLRPKEIDHLIRCGALDGLATSRAASLAEAEQVRHGSVAQMVFDFGVPEVAPETLSQQWAWETELLGVPVSALADPLAPVKDGLPAHLPLRELPASRGRPVIVAGVRLPGWTGGPGFFLSDGDDFVIARGDKTAKSPPPWQPLLVRGRWIGDGWGTFWLQADSISVVG
jgi:DNA polymerase-3 subunit alpha